MRLKKLDWEVIEELYFNEKYSITELSKLYNVTRVAIYDHFKRHKRSSFKKLWDFAKRMFAWESN